MPPFASLLEIVATIATAAIAGGILLFAIVVTPSLFASLDQGMARRFLRDAFPRYYAYLAIAGGLAAVAVNWRHPRLGLLLLAIAVSALAVRQLGLPRMNAMRDAEANGDEAAGARFRVWHRATVVLNVLQLFAACVILLRLR